MSHKSHISGSKLLGQLIENDQIFGTYQQVIENERTIARLQTEIDDLRRKLNNNNTDNNNYGGKKRSNRRKHVKHNKKTRKGSRMHKKRR
jgi:FtsZ-binding cell division protein ZapB